MAKQERESERTRTRVKALVTTTDPDKPLAGFTRDVSRSGLFVQVRSPHPPGTPVKIELQYPDGRVDLEGVVVRAERVPVHLQSMLTPGMGIQLQPSPGIARAVGTSRSPRVPLGSDVVVFFGSERLRLKLHDLSTSGAALLADRELPEMAFVRMHFKLPSDTEVVEVEGVPVGRRSLGQDSVIAINFLDPPADFVSRIEALISQRGAKEKE